MKENLQSNYSQPSVVEWSFILEIYPDRPKEKFFQIYDYTTQFMVSQTSPWEHQSRRLGEPLKRLNSVMAAYQSNLFKIHNNVTCFIRRLKSFTT